ncbi:hypothetical protein FVEG_16353 [Fusarium verticillioides 7600]|uniref:Uncharacterized protein n=1 Tax=Gibberella moniliformis (strain M3125 / FGSC 7600) TaxID=334819 RepID=W7MMZ1_GIBM7|nr:hypothetical protein FVEG_16353 [Fusarium verticillioides 7600]EWG48895.1 hypothetical protein FVEG_16353 [Fusarium verticillioides 7600]
MSEMHEQGSKLPGLWRPVAMGEGYGKSWETAHVVASHHRQFGFAYVKRLSISTKRVKHLCNDGIASEQQRRSGLFID